MPYMNRKLLFKVGTWLLLCLLCCQCTSTGWNKPATPEDQARAICLGWNNLLLELERHTPGYRPPVSARMFAYVALSAYETALPALPGRRSLEKDLPGFQKTALSTENQTLNLPASLNACYAHIAARFFFNAEKTVLAQIDRLEKLYKNEFQLNKNEYFTYSEKYGKSVAEQVWQYSMTDSIGHNGYLYNYDRQYQSPQCNGCWQSAEPDRIYALLPNWGKVRTFIVPLQAVPSQPPMPFSEKPGSPFYTEAMEVYSVSQTLSKENKWIAEFWSDDLEGFTLTPAGRWISIVNQVVEKTNPDFETTLQVYLKTSLALGDVAIHCWASKYQYNLERPQAYIQRIIDPNWLPLHGTPAFPAYPSGHACFGAAVATVLAHFFGDQYTLEDRTHQDRDEFVSTPRTFHAFSEMARENALSRIVGGVHYRMDCEEGLRIGQIIGQKIAVLPLQSSKVSLK